MGIPTPTVSALLHATHVWLQNLERGHEIGAVFFDTVPHQPLISELERIGLDPFIITWCLPSREISESGV